MFTGIIESLGEIVSFEKREGAIEFEIRSSFTKDLRPDESVAHNGVCLTVTKITGDTYFVTAIPETLRKTNLCDLKVGSRVNLERSMKASGRFDGHIVQGHVDQTAICVGLQKEGESTIYQFEYDASLGNITVEKGSICVNGISLTVVNSLHNQFSVAIIPYTFYNTNIQSVVKGSVVNLEFDIVGKYLNKLFVKYSNNQ